MIETATASLDYGESAPVISRVDYIVGKAIESGASDIHFESTDNHLRVRYRIDGVLYDQPSVEKKIMQQLISRLKVLARIDITEKRIPQDGKFRITAHNHSIDVRVSSFPNIYGETLVLRILDRSQTAVDLNTLGFNQSMLASFKKLVHCSNGFFLVTGPTGSGKTTTLYGALASINTPEKNIITLEDPVEYNMDGITQGQIKPEAGFTFEKGIRAILRQDPDVIMVGEIRDVQTARIAIEAALTGHLVFSTLHTNDAPGALMRLMDMGIEPFLLNAALSGVLAQRLARKICSGCRTNYVPNEHEKEMCSRFGIAQEQLHKGVGCSECLNLGYKGRTGIFELLTMTSVLRSLIVKQPVFDTIYAQARTDGLKTLLEDGIEKVKNGIITLDELARVVA